MKLLKDKRYGIPCIQSTNLDLQLLHYGSNQEGGDNGKGDLSGETLNKYIFFKFVWLVV